MKSSRPSSAQCMSSNASTSGRCAARRDDEAPPGGEDRRTRRTTASRDSSPSSTRSCSSTVAGSSATVCGPPVPASLRPRSAYRCRRSRRPPSRSRRATSTRRRRRTGWSVPAASESPPPASGPRVAGVSCRFPARRSSVTSRARLSAVGRPQPLADQVELGFAAHERRSLAPRCAIGVDRRRRRDGRHTRWVRVFPGAVIGSPASKSIAAAVARCVVSVTSTAFAGALARRRSAVLTASPTTWPSRSPPTRTSPVSTPIRTSKWSSWVVGGGLCYDVDDTRGRPGPRAPDRLRARSARRTPQRASRRRASRRCRRSARAPCERVRRNGSRTACASSGSSAVSPKPARSSEECGHDLALFVHQLGSARLRVGISSAWILIEDLPLELPKRLAGLEPELLDQHAPGLSVDLERVGLPAGAVEGEHQLAAQSFTERLPTRSRASISADEPGVAARARDRRRSGPRARRAAAPRGARSPRRRRRRRRSRPAPGPATARAPRGEVVPSPGASRPRPPPPGALSKRPASI